MNWGSGLMGSKRLVGDVDEKWVRCRRDTSQDAPWEDIGDDHPGLL